MVLKFDQGTYNFSDTAIKWLQAMVIALFLGRAWQGLFWDMPLRSFFWDESLLGGLVTTLTGDTWQNYVTNVSVPSDQLIDALSVVIGIFWLCCAAIVPFGFRYPKLAKVLLYTGSVTLGLLAILYAKDHYWQVGQLLEYAAQVTAPIFLVAIFQPKANTPRFRFWLRVVIATTFVCHGLYAAAFYPQPGMWISWCRNILGFQTDEGVRQFLILMGVLDFVAAAGLFVPWRWVFVPAVWYCVIWGFLTAFARIVGNFYADVALSSLHQHSYEVFYRLVHGGLPVLLWWAYQQATTTTAATNDA